ncbi:MAG: hypothetical protein L0I13_04345, partial [Lactococcus plantarum]|nr:hypothetical protein [Lactococcus plantarum]
MLKYLLKKTIKTDEGYKRYQLLWLPLRILLILIMYVVIYQQFGMSSTFYGVVVGSSMPLAIYFIWLVRLLRDPKRLKAARLRLTDERRKIVEQEVWAHIGWVMMLLTTCLMVSVLFLGTIQLNVYPFIGIVYAMLIYR